MLSLLCLNFEYHQIEKKGNTQTRRRKYEIHENYYGIEAFHEIHRIREDKQKKVEVSSSSSFNSHWVGAVKLDRPQKNKKKRTKIHTQQIYDESFRFGFIILWIFSLRFHSRLSNLLSE